CARGRRLRPFAYW
nr:immunoglobulin heavy chain junction region [Mus musculus]